MPDILLTSPDIGDNGSALISPADMLARSSGPALLMDFAAALVSPASILPRMGPITLVGPDDPGPPAGGKFTVPVTIAFG